VSDGPSEETQIAVLGEQMKALTAAFTEHRQQYQKDQESNTKALKELKSALDMARGGYFVLAVLGAVLVYFTGIFGKAISALSHWNTA